MDYQPQYLVAEKLLRDHEGEVKNARGRHIAYKCPAGKITVGVGRNLEDLGLSDDEVSYLLKNDIKRVEQELKSNFSFYDRLNASRKAVLIDMCFNIGLPKILLFENMIQALEGGDFDRAADEMLDSRWAKQVGRRADRLSAIMRSES
ncbi:glycoside hydrolase family protein [Idiomarina piscisalsi]|uniref:Lysozyme n=1 Tax=Idiomarina piscisalsi TaxID=1096243 RepID=A0A432YXE4_9GAMM|nr:glycoside hydrolase family protein [Idiomarina piscisalsi]RUO67977.1 lysozyme [Idiomarina piscisalsi]